MINIYMLAQSPISKAFLPIMNMIQDVAYPICYLCIAVGFIMIMVGSKNKGMTMLKYSIIGFIGLQFLPAIMALIQEVGVAMRNG